MKHGLGPEREHSHIHLAANIELSAFARMPRLKGLRTVPRGAQLSQGLPLNDCINEDLGHRRIELFNFDVSLLAACFRTQPKAEEKLKQSTRRSHR
jgi:hypothetical protein